MSKEEERIALFRKRGNICFRNKKFNHAIKFYNKALKISPPEIRHLLLSNLSACYLQLKEYHNALDMAKRCTEMNPSFEKGYLRLIRSCIGLGDYDYASFLLRSFIKDEKLYQALENDLKKVSFPSTPYKMEIIKNMTAPSEQDSNRRRSIFELETFYPFIYKEKIFMFGGFLAEWHKLNKLMVLEGTKWREIGTTGNKPYPISHFRHLVCEDEKSVYIWGGDTYYDYDREYSPPHTGDIYKLNLETFEWVILRSPPDSFVPFPREMSAFGRLESKFYCVGGMYRTGTEIKNKEEEMLVSFDLETMKWEKIQLQPKLTVENGMMQFLMFQPHSSIFSKSSGHPLATCHVNFSKMVWIIDLKTGIYKKTSIDIHPSTYFLSKLKYDDPKVPPHPQDTKLGNLWDGEDVREFSFFQTSEKIHHHRHEQRVDGYFALFKDRYFLRLDLEKNRWEEIGYISNFKIVDGLIKKKVQPYLDKLSRASNSGSSTTIHQGDLNWKTKYDMTNIAHYKPQFHSFCVRKDLVYCFCSSQFLRPENSMVVFRIESTRNMELKKKALMLSKMKKYVDVSIFCSFF